MLHWNVEISSRSCDGDNFVSMCTQLPSTQLFIRLYKYNLQGYMFRPEFCVMYRPKFQSKHAVI
jgi:hypothetical protein